MVGFPGFIKGVLSKNRKSYFYFEGLETWHVGVTKLCLKGVIAKEPLYSMVSQFCLRPCAEEERLYPPFDQK